MLRQKLFLWFTLLSLFEGKSHYKLNGEQMGKLLQRFSRGTKDAEAAVVYYAGYQIK